MVDTNLDCLALWKAHEETFREVEQADVQCKENRRSVDCWLSEREYKKSVTDARDALTAYLSVGYVLMFFRTYELADLSFIVSLGCRPLPASLKTSRH
jgi:hypothetical protein